MLKQKLPRVLQKRHIAVVFGVATVSLLGYALLGSSSAASYATSSEVETGTLSRQAATLTSDSASNGQAVKFGNPQPLADTLKSLKLMNYYPSNHTWGRMWTEFDTAKISEDFTNMRVLGANSVRIIVHTYAFGYPTPTPIMQDRLSQMVAMAATHGLKVQLTLFDGLDSYTDTASSDQWANAILKPYKNDARIVFVEVQNEMNPTNTVAMTWLRHEVPVFQQAVGTIPVTVSVTNIGSADVSHSLPLLVQALNGVNLDFYDAHFYGGAPALPVFSQLKQTAGAKPLFIGEVGVSTWDGGTGSGRQGETDQDINLRDYQYSARRLDLGYAAIWDFQDFNSGQVDTQKVGTYNEQNFFGLIKTNGGYKPAAYSMQKYFTTGVLDTSGLPSAGL